MINNIKKNECLDTNVLPAFDLNPLKIKKFSSCEQSMMKNTKGKENIKH